MIDPGGGWLGRTASAIEDDPEPSRRLDWLGSLMTQPDRRRRGDDQAGPSCALAVPIVEIAERYLTGRTDGLSAVSGEAILLART